MYKQNQYTDDWESPVLIVGCVRSGTTLFRQMLNSHPHLAIFHESFIFRSWHLLSKYFKTGHTNNDENMKKFITFFLEKYNPYGQRTRPMFEFLDTPTLRSALMNCDGSSGTILKTIMESWARSQEKSRWGDKVASIHCSESLQMMYKIFPQAKFIHVVRDPRGVTHSLIKSRWARNSLDAACRWRYSVLNIRDKLSEIPASQVFEIRYEDLCINPREKLEQVCMFLNEEYSPKMLEYYKKKDEVVSNIKVAEIVRNIDKPLIQSNYSKWHDGLTKRQIRVVEYVNSPLMNLYGYSTLAGSDSLLDYLKVQLYLKLWLHKVNPYRRFRQRTKLLYNHLMSGLS